MFGGIKVAHPSCQIRHAVTCSFFHKSGADGELRGSNLVLASLDRLWVYGLNTVTRSAAHQAASGSRLDKPSLANEAHVFLECLAEYGFHGDLLDLAWIPLGYSTGVRDSLVLAFADAKISVVEYDPLLHDLRTISMHYYENDYEGTQEARQLWMEQPPAVRADVSRGRFIIGRVYDTKIAVIACTRDIVAGGVLNSVSSSNQYGRLTGSVPADQMASVVIDCCRMPVGSGISERIAAIVDLQVVPTDAEQPTVVLLCRREASGMMSDSRIGVRWNDSCFVVVVTIDYGSKTLHPIWVMSQLPNDCCRIKCVPRAGGDGALGGFLVVSHNVVAYLKQGAPSYAVSVNEAGRTATTSSTHFSIQAHAGLNSTFVGAQCEFLEHDKLLLGSSNGRLYMLTLVHAAGAHGICAMHWQYVGMSTATSCVSLVVGEYVFIGSRLGDSLLMRCRAREDEALQRAMENVVLASSNMDKKAAINGERNMGLSAVEQEDEEIYGVTVAHTKAAESARKFCMKSYTFTEQDTLPSYGPFTDAAYADIPGVSIRSGLRKTLDRPIEIMTTSGCDTNGVLCVFRRSVRPLIQTSVSVRDAADVWSITSTDGQVFLLASIRGVGYSRTAIYKVLIGNRSGTADKHFATVEESAGGVMLQKIEKDSAFIHDETTLYAGLCPAAPRSGDEPDAFDKQQQYTYALQVTATKLALIASTDFTYAPAATTFSGISSHDGAADARSFRSTTLLWNQLGTERVATSPVSVSPMPNLPSKPSSSIPTLGSGIAVASAGQTPQQTAIPVPAPTTIPVEVSSRAAYIHPFVVVQSTRGRTKLFRMCATQTTRAESEFFSHTLEPIDFPPNIVSDAAAANSDDSNSMFVGLYEDCGGMFSSSLPRHVKRNTVATPAWITARLAAVPKTVASSTMPAHTVAEAASTIEGTNKNTSNGAAVPGVVDDVLKEEDAFLYGEMMDSSLDNARSRKRIKSDEADDDEEYNGLHAKFKSNRASARRFSEMTPEQTTRQLHNSLLLSDAAKTIWLYTVDAAHILRIYSLPGMQLMFSSCYSLRLGARVLHEEAVLRGAGIKIPMPQQMSSDSRQLKDCLIFGLGVRHSRPYLMYVLDEDVFIYEIYPFYYDNNNTASSGTAVRRLQIAMRRVDTLETPLITRKRVLKLRKGDSSQLYIKGVPGWCQLRPFTALAAAAPRNSNNVAGSTRIDGLGYGGVFLCSHAPHWLVSGARGQLRHHPMDADGRIIAFTPILCRAPADAVEGKFSFMAYAYINGREELRVAAFDAQFNYDNYWPVKRIPLPFTAAAALPPVALLPAGVVSSGNNSSVDVSPESRQQQRSQREMPEYVVYLAAQRVYAVIHYVLHPLSKVIHPSTGVVPDEDKIVETVERTADAMLPHERKYSVSLLQLHAPLNLAGMLSQWSTEAAGYAEPTAADRSYKFIPDAHFPLQEYEQVCVARSVVLNSEANVSGKSEYLVLGTVYAYGEDLQCRGRIVVLEARSVAVAVTSARGTEEGLPSSTGAGALKTPSLATFQIRSVCIEEQKGPVTALCGLHQTGDLCGAVGQRIYIWSMRNGRLIGRAMVDVDIYPCDIKTMKSMIFVADAYTSLTMLQYQAEFRTLGVVAKGRQGAASGSAARLRLNKVELCADGAQLACLCANDCGDVLTMSYEPEQTTNISGSTLAVRSEFHLGSHCNAMIRTRARAWDPTNERQALAIFLKRHVVYFFSTSGSISYFVPSSERTYRRLMMLQTLLANHCGQRAGLNPRDFRKCRTPRPVELSSRPLRRQMADLNLVLFFLLLGTDEQKELAKKVGCTVDDILEELAELTRSALIC